MRRTVFVVVFTVTLAWPCVLFAQEFGKAAFKSVTFLLVEKPAKPKIVNWVLVSPLLPVIEWKEEDTKICETEESGINWLGLLRGSGMFLSVEHLIRASNPHVRANFGGKYWPDYHESLKSIHGFSDGDSWMVNYIAHGAQGAVSMAIFARNDPKSQHLVVGMNKAYWKAKARQAIFAFAYSEWFEMGPFLSETSTGNLGYQYGHNAYGDQVWTPITGTGFSFLEDILYAKVILKVAEPNSRYANMLVIFLNPFRSVANLMLIQYPWRGITLR